jgi:hypothetical protein
MTDQLDSQFQIFSDMLDQEASLSAATLAGLDQDAELLLELRAHLRQRLDRSELPEGFAASTAAEVERRYRELPLSTRGLLRLEPVLRANPFSRTGLTWLFGFALLGLGATAISWQLLGLLGALALLSGLGLVSWAERTHLPGLMLPEMPPGLDQESGALRKLKSLFYLVPSLAVLATAGLAGLAMSHLSSLSLSLQAQSDNYVTAMGLGGGLVAFAWMINALWPLLRWYEEATRGRALRTFVVQALHAAWLMAALFLLRDISRPERSDWKDPGSGSLVILGVCAVVLLGLSWVLSWRRAVGPRHYYLWPAIKRGVKGFLVGLIPIVAVLSLFYQAILTRELTVESRYQAMRGLVDSWLKENQAIAPEENGFHELPEVFKLLHKDAQTHVVTERIQAGSRILSLYQHGNPAESDGQRQQLARARQAFLEVLPRIEAALARPHFSYMTDGTLDLSTRLPNYLLVRSVAQGLEGLVRDSLARGEVAEALHYLELNLRWSARFHEGGLMGVVMGCSLQLVATESVAHMIRDFDLSEAQLRQLMVMLQQHSLQRGDFQTAMYREIYSCERSLQRLVAGDPSMFEGISAGNPGSLLRLVPRSYWESERKVYLNLTLAHASAWYDLGRPEDDLVEVMRVLPWSMTTQTMVPNIGRAQLNFMLILSRTNALQVALALQLYRKRHGAYPATLESLVPEYLPELPVDPMHPNLWKKKPPLEYARTEQGYTLTSESPLYQKLKYVPRQVLTLQDQLEYRRSDNR